MTAAELMYSPPDLHFEVETHDSEVALCFDNRHDPASGLYFVWSFLSTHRGMCWLIDERILLQRVEFRQLKAAECRDAALIFQCDVVTPASRNALVFDQSYLAKSIGRSLSELKEYLRRRPLDVLYRPGKDLSLAAQVTQQMRQRLSTDRVLPSAAGLAQQLSMAEHSLRRQLAREGATLQRLKDRLRQTLAAELLMAAETDVDELAAALGYTETNSFYRAFKKWFGLSPQKYLQRRRG
jgi:AraC-like DNA-binding protein